MTLYQVADWMREHRCFERQRTGTCNCGSGRKNNPCEIADTLIENCEAGENLGEVEKFISRKMCRNKGKCNHRGCIKAEKVLVELQSLQVRKAA